MLKLKEDDFVVVKGIVGSDSVKNETLAKVKGFTSSHIKDRKYLLVSTKSYNKFVDSKSVEDKYVLRIATKEDISKGESHKYGYIDESDAKEIVEKIMKEDTSVVADIKLSIMEKLDVEYKLKVIDEAKEVKSGYMRTNYGNEYNIKSVVEPAQKLASDIGLSDSRLVAGKILDMCKYSKIKLTDLISAVNDGSISGKVVKTAVTNKNLRIPTKSTQDIIDILKRGSDEK